MSDIDKVLTDRGSRYGVFADHALITQTIKDAMSLGRNWMDLEVDMREALEMVAHKVGRILNGDPTYIDSWTDIIGYTRLVEKRLIDEQESVRGMLRDNVVPFPNGKLEKQVELDLDPECDCTLCRIHAALAAVPRRAA